MGMRSTFRSNTIRTGRDDAVPADDAGLWPELENRLSFEFRI
jgi:hypothetical protein